MSSNANPITDPGQPLAALESAGLRLAIVVAATDNGVIGRDGRLPWHLPDDLKRFKSLTLGKPVLMGRKTYDSIGKPLVDRPNIVLTRNPGWEAPHVIVVHSLAEALKRARPATELMVIGGADIFALCLPLTGRIHLTQVHSDLPGDTYFTLPSSADWREVAREEHAADARHAAAFSFRTLERVAS